MAIPRDLLLPDGYTARATTRGAYWLRPGEARLPRKTVTVARVEGGMVVAYASSGPAESGGRLSVPVGDWWAFVEGCDLLEVAEDSE